jgi:hypothetical protein
MSDIRRREFITLVSGVAAVRTQQADRMRRIGVLMSFAEDDIDTKTRLAGFRRELESLGRRGHGLCAPGWMKRSRVRSAQRSALRWCE